MKKLLLLTGIFLSLAVMASAQVRKSTTRITHSKTQAPQQKKTIKTLEQQRIAQKTARGQANVARRTAKKGTTAQGARETLETKAN